MMSASLLLPLLIACGEDNKPEDSAAPQDTAPPLDTARPTDTGDTGDTALPPVPMDVVLVFDRSGSMADSGAYLAAAAADIAAAFPADTVLAFLDIGPSETAGELMAGSARAGDSATVRWLAEYFAETGGGTGTEEGLEAVYQMLCRMSDPMPAACTDGTSLQPSDAGSISGVFRPGAALMAVFISDEGDTSRRMAQGDEDPAPYLTLFEETGINVRFSGLIPTDWSCNNGGATTWGVARYATVIANPSGVSAPIETFSTGVCSPGDYAAFFQQVAALETP